MARFFFVLYAYLVKYDMFISRENLSFIQHTVLGMLSKRNEGSMTCARPDTEHIQCLSNMEFFKPTFQHTKQCCIAKYVCKIMYYWNENHHLYTLKLGFLGLRMAWSDVLE